MDPIIKPINLLWTGGWDSTFRLLQVLIDYKLSVQPIYIIDTARASTLIEIDTRHAILKKIVEQYPYTEELILPTKYFSLQDIEKNQEITDKYKALKKKIFLGSQYDWLARFSAQFQIENLELSIERSDRITHFKDMDRFQLNSSSHSGDIYTLRDSIETSDPITLFRPFHFPILGITKVDMLVHSEKKGYLDILNESWFCFTPIAGQACGLCNPCRNVVLEGMGYRLPVSSQRRNKYHKAYDFAALIRKTARRQVRKYLPKYA